MLPRRPSFSIQVSLFAATFLRYTLLTKGARWELTSCRSSSRSSFAFKRSHKRWSSGVAATAPVSGFLFNSKIKSVVHNSTSINLSTGASAKPPNFLPFRANRKSSMSASIALDVLQRKDASSTNALLNHFVKNDTFAKWADYQSTSILTRDAEDGDKLQHGIDIAVERGTLQKLDTEKMQPYLDVDVVGKTPDEVASFIWDKVVAQKAELSSKDEGELIVLCGLSGTGKGTTFATLGEKLRKEKDPGKVVNWSNGNVFRSVTLLSVLWCEQQGPEIHVTTALTKENIANFMGMLEFGKINGKYDTSIKGMGLDTTVSKIENTLLKQTRVGKNIPTVAEQIQGEVVKFANEAMTILRQAGMTILLEGREQTLNYMETPHKFRLVLSDQSLIGKRRAAQRLMAEALDRIENNDGKELDIAQILDEVLNSMAAEDLATDEGCCAMPAFLTAKE